MGRCSVAERVRRGTEWASTPTRLARCPWGFSRQLAGPELKVYEIAGDEWSWRERSQANDAFRAILWVFDQEQGWCDQAYISTVKGFVERGLWTGQWETFNRTGERCAAKYDPSNLWWQRVISVSCYMVPKCLFVIASRADLWGNLSLITNSISRLGFKLILALSTRRNCQWRFTVIFQRMCCRLRKHLEWVPTMLWARADSFKSGYRQASHYFEGDST